MEFILLDVRFRRLLAALRKRLPVAMKGGLPRVPGPVPIPVIPMGLSQQEGQGEYGVGESSYVNLPIASLRRVR
jgi:hypothetical protein